MQSFRGVSHSLSTDLVYYERQDTHSKDEIIIDTLGATWMLAWLDQGTSPIQLFLNGRWQVFQANHFLFMAPYSVLRWKFAAGVVNWRAYVSYRSYPELWIPESCLLPLNLEFCPRSAREVLQYVSCEQNKMECQALHSNRLGLKLKQEIDRSYKEKLLIDDLAQQFEVSRISLFRHFKNQFGFAPTQYRQRLRLFEAIRLVHLGESVTRSVLDSGFTDLSEFNKQFRRVFYTTPREFIRSTGF